MRILALDRWSKTIGLARWSTSTKITFPLWFLSNDEHTVADLADLIKRYEISNIVYGFVHSKQLRRQLQALQEQLHAIYPNIQRAWCSEAYTTVQADVLLNTHNHPGQDSVAAMYILDTYISTLTPAA